MTDDRLPYFSESVLGNAAWRILSGHVSRRYGGSAVTDPEQFRRELERASDSCTQCNLNRRYGPRQFGCWHRAALLLLDQGLRSWTRSPPPAELDPLDPRAIERCVYCDEDGRLWRDGVRGHCSHRPVRQVTELTVPAVLNDGEQP